ncbi:hypothetical protein [Marinobacter sp. ELB17]|uniref:hypothetical protein n=1 Tax=Marinobacter sp. ELB17 TaxID=270374 RepID=UPI0012F47E05|nr:hypothetical protein [Marinobacter sp. ELB17]
MELSFATFRNRWIKISNSILNKTPVAHHGIQRSGTNYLNLCLRSLGVVPVNSFDPARGAASHKHCRWQSAKKSIMPWDSRYQNDYQVAELEQLDSLANYPPNCRHLVIQKDLASWLPSILNWGLRVGWLRSKEEAIKQAATLAKADYEAYYDFWHAQANKYPGRVVVIQFESIIEDPRSLVEICRKMGVGVQNSDSFDGKFKEVPQSPSGRQAVVTRLDVEHMLN